VPELFDHFFLYKGEQSMIEWPDAFYNDMWLSADVKEETVARFASKLGVSYKYIDSV
jgi:hypothetical protein